MEKNKKTKTEEELKQYKEQGIKINYFYKEYYKSILGMNPVEYEEFLKYSEKDLPITFRINKIK